MNRRSAQTEWVPLDILWGRAMRTTGPAAKSLQSMSTHSDVCVFSSIRKLTR